MRLTIGRLHEACFYFAATSQLFSVLLFTLLFSRHAASFGTINEPDFVGQHCEHEHMTRAAFGCKGARSDGICFEALSLMQLAGTSGPPGALGMGWNGAVGAPDLLDPVPEGPEAHCDNADFLDTTNMDIIYPQSREGATQALQECIDHLRERYDEGLIAASRIMDQRNVLAKDHIDISDWNCTYSFPSLQMQMFSRSKCSIIEGFGRSLHGVQDFYAHSNWADQSKPPYGPSNPPGLGRKDAPEFLDLRASNDIAAHVPYDLSTGCFGGVMTDGEVGKPGHPLEPGSKDCTGRITHGALNKDNGIIDPNDGSTWEPGPNTPRSDYPGNFDAAVQAAIRDSKRQWLAFRNEIRRRYGAAQGNIINCAIVRDFPLRDCYDREIAIVRDSAEPESGISLLSLHSPTPAALQEELGWSDAGDGSCCRNNRTIFGSYRLENMVHPYLGPSFDYLDHVEETDALSSLDLVIDELTRTGSNFTSRKSGILIMTDSETPPTTPLSHLPHFEKVKKAGIRINYGLFRQPFFPEAPAPSPIVMEKPGSVHDLDINEHLANAVLSTGGTFTIITDPNPDSQRQFIDHVISHGLTDVDNPGDTSTTLFPDLTIASYIPTLQSPNSTTASPYPERRFAHTASAGEIFCISVRPITQNLTLLVKLHDIKHNMDVQIVRVGPSASKANKRRASVDWMPISDSDLELIISVWEGGRQNHDARDRGLFTVGLSGSCTNETVVASGGEDGEYQLKGSVNASSSATALG